MSERLFPIMDAPAIPWSVIAPCERQARVNHAGQSLEDLARRGGLAAIEAVWVLRLIPCWGWAGTREEARAELARLVTERHWQPTIDRLQAEVARLNALLNTPEILDFTRAVTLEAAHQRERWGSAHDGGKTDADWFWLIGYLAGKALHNPPTPDGRTAEELKLHRIITVAAAACNWHAAVLGQTNMRPGIEPPSGAQE